MNTVFRILRNASWAFMGMSVYTEMWGSVFIFSLLALAFDLLVDDSVKNYSK